MIQNLSIMAIILAIILCVAACASPSEQSVSDAPVLPPSSESATPEPSSESQIEDNPLPPEERIASITPARLNQILEKKKENSDAVGWLTVPGTTIDDVILLNPVGDNNYYTTHDFSRQPNRNGAYGMDYRHHFSEGAARDTLSRNTPLYAHNHDDDPDGILFAQLKKYKDPDFAKKHPYIFFSTLDEDMVWEVFAVFDATTEFPYIVPGVYWDSFRELLDTVLEASIYDYGVSLSENDKLLTLSTCTFSVAGHEAMPITVENKYRFVVMARLVSPEEQIKYEAAFTVNSSPLAPDDIPPFPYLTSDMFVLNGLEYSNSWLFFENNNSIEPIDYNKLLPIGKIQRGNAGENLEDWHATQLPAGTVVYQDPDYVDVIVADVGWAMIPYVAQRPERELHSVRYIHRNREGVITDKSLEVGRFDMEEQLERLSPYIDMANFTLLAAGMGEIDLRDDQEVIRLGAKNTLSTFYQTFFLGTPASIGKEVMIIEQSDGRYYGDAALYAQLAEILDSLFV